MANTSINRGLDPEWAQGPTPPTQKYNPFTTSGSLFINSAFIDTLGVPVAAAVGATPATDFITGSIKIIYDVNGFPITNVATATAVGGAEGSNDPDQKYRITMDAATTEAASVGFGVNLGAETGTVGTNAYGSLAYPGTTSKRQITQATLVAIGTARQLTIIGLGSDEFASDPTAANCEFYVRIQRYQA